MGACEQCDGRDIHEICYASVMISPARELVLTAEVTRSSRTILTNMLPGGSVACDCDARKGAERRRRVATYDRPAERSEAGMPRHFRLGSTLRIWSSWHTIVSLIHLSTHLHACIDTTPGLISINSDQIEIPHVQWDLPCSQCSLLASIATSCDPAFV
jgi:hypothetical protein